MKNSLLFLSVVLGGGLLLATVYGSVVDSVAWGSDIPRSIEVAREYYKHTNPGVFFRIFAPATQLTALLVLGLFWKRAKQVRLYLGMASLLYILADVLTFSYFYPRNDLMFTLTPLTDVGTLRNTWTEWSNMNWVRISIVLAGVFFSCMALHRIYTTLAKVTGH